MADDPKTPGQNQADFDSAVNINDQLKNQVDNMRRLSTVRKEQLKISEQIVESAQTLNTELLSQQDIIKEIQNLEGKRGELQKVQNNLAKDLSKDEKEYLNMKLTEKDLQDKSLTSDMKAYYFGQQQLENLNKIVATMEKEKVLLGKVNDALGVSGGALKSINKLFGGALGNTDEILKNSQKRIKLLGDEGKLTGGIGDKFKGLSIISNEVGKSLMKNLNDPLMYIKIALDYSDQINKFQKGLGLSYTQAASLRGEMTEIAAASGNMAVNSKKVQETFMTLNQQFGTASTTLATMFPEVVTEATKLQHLMGLSAKSTAEFAKMSIVAGKPLKAIKEDTIGAVKAAEAETGARLNIKEVLEATGQVSGQIKAQLAANPEAIAKAVAVAKQFGMELKDIEATSKSLLQFETSIEAELKAELLTGKQLNLERARLAALTGDYETLAREINEQVGTFADFSKMNVLQQDALAASLGMTSDQLSEQLLQKANLNELAEEARASGNEELAQQLEARSASEKFQDVVMKIQTIFSDLVGGPLAGVIDLLGSALGIVNLILEPIGFVAGAVAKIASFDFKNMTALQGVVGGIATVLLGIKATTMAINGYRTLALGIERKIRYQKIMQERSGKTMGLLDKVLVALGLKRAAAEGSVNVQKTIGNRKGVFDLLRSAGSFVLKMFQAGASAPFPANLVLPFVLGAVAGGIAAAMIAKFSKGDDVFSGGYGKRTLLMPEGAIALNDKDTVIAGTKISKGDDVISGPTAVSDPIDYDKLAAATSNQTVTATMQYDNYAARDYHGRVSYGEFASKNKIQ